jgi:hypothetical protein
MQQSLVWLPLVCSHPRPVRCVSARRTCYRDLDKLMAAAGITEADLNESDDESGLDMPTFDEVRFYPPPVVPFTAQATSLQRVSLLQRPDLDQGDGDVNMGDDDDSDVEYELPEELVAAGHTVESLSALTPEQFEAEMKRLNVDFGGGSDMSENDSEYSEGDSDLEDMGSGSGQNRSRFEQARNAREEAHLAELLGKRSADGGSDSELDELDLDELEQEDDGDDVALPDDPEQLEKLLASLEREYRESGGQSFKPSHPSTLREAEWKEPGSGSSGSSSSRKK